MTSRSALGIDHAVNLLSIGVTGEGLDGSFEDELVARGVPPEVWTSEVVAALEPATSLRDFHRPLVGGQQITRNRDFASCTYGLTAIRQDVLGFITNSHCTNVRGGVEGTRFAQPFFTADGSRIIGVETVDPRYFTGRHFIYGDLCRGRRAAATATAPSWSAAARRRRR